MLTSLPNLLTLSRILAIPVLVWLFFVPAGWARFAACAVFVAAALTDFFDGYLARAWRQQSTIGRVLDPIADKLLVSAAIVMLIAFDHITEYQVLPALVILCREVLISGLREYLAGLRITVPVSRLAKWKTAIQMTAIGVLIVANDVSPTLPMESVGDASLWTAALLTIITGFEYARGAFVQLRGAEKNRLVEGARPARPLG